MIPPLDGGRLPLGRWPASVEEVRGVFAGPGSSTRRQEVWEHWVQLTDAVRSIVGAIPAAWVSGSFLTDKLEPGDLDCLYVIEGARLAAAAADPRHGPFLDLVARSQVKSTFGLLVDSFILEWVPTPGVGRSVGAAGYFADRGYWDDLWGRERSTDPRDDSIPRRGYLEVILDGYR